MNQEQRKFLVSHVERQFNNDMDKLKRKRPKPPSMNNYIVAAALDGTLKYQPVTKIAEHIRALVLSLGHSDVLIHDETYGRHGRDYDDDDDDDLIPGNVTVKAECLFVLPKAFVAAREQFIRDLELWNKAKEELQALHETVLLKVQIGSNEVLDKLITEVDSMAGLKLLNTTITVAASHQLKEKN